MSLVCSGIWPLEEAAAGENPGRRLNVIDCLSSLALVLREGSEFMDYCR